MDEVQEIKQRLDIIEVISSYLTLKRAGINYKGLCPFHNEKTPSFMVSAERQTFKCFGCGEGGDIFTFIEKMEGLDFYNALKILADRAGVKLKSTSIKHGDREHQADKKTRLYEINDWAKKLYHKILIDHPKAEQARKYLNSRGLSNITIKEFEIGYAPNSWELLVKFLKAKGYSEEEAWQAGVAIRSDKGSYYDRFRGRVIFPINNIMGTTIAFTSRVLDPDAKEAKYINSAESAIYRKGDVLYGLDKARMAIKEKDLAILVEGNMDVISCHQAGFKNIVAASGTALTEQQLKILTRYASLIAFCFDSDKAGIIAMKRAITMALKNDVTCKIISLPKPYKDPDEAIKADPKIWESAIKISKPALEYWIDLLIATSPDMSVISKKGIVKEILPVIKNIYSDIEKEFYIKFLSQKLSISEQALIDALRKTKSETKKVVEQRAEKKQELSLEQRLAGLLWFAPDLIKGLTEGERNALAFPELPEFNKMLIRGEINRQVLKQSEALILDQFVILLSSELELEDFEKLKAEIHFLRKRISSERKEEIKAEFAAKIQQAEAGGDKNKVRELLTEYAKLIK